MDKILRGSRAELIAQKFLQSRGLILRDKNFRCKMGEIDLIMMDGDTIVFVEVRFRMRDDFGDGATSVNTHKQRKISLTALFYLQKKGLCNCICRFDVISQSEEKNGVSKINWIQNAFENTGYRG